MSEKSEWSGWEYLRSTLQLFSPGKGVSDETYFNAVYAVTAGWPYEDFDAVCAFLLEKRVSAFRPTCGELTKIRSSIVDLDTRAAAFADARWPLDESPQTRFINGIVRYAFVAGALSAPSDGVPPEQLEILGKFLIKKSREAGQ